MLSATEINSTALSLMPDVRSLLLRMGVDAGNLDDAMQDAFILLVTYVLPRYDGRGKLRTYALAVVKARALNGRTRGHARFEREGFDPETETSSEGFMARERAVDAQAIRAGLAKLTDRERALLMAFEDCGQWRDAGKAIGVSAATVTRLRASIQEKLS